MMKLNMEKLVTPFMKNSSLHLPFTKNCFILLVKYRQEVKSDLQYCIWVQLHSDSYQKTSRNMRGLCESKSRLYANNFLLIIQ